MLPIFRTLSILTLNTLAYGLMVTTNVFALLPLRPFFPDSILAIARETARGAKLRPMAYAFWIWPLIYLLHLGFLLYQWASFRDVVRNMRRVPAQAVCEARLGNVIVREMGTLYALSCLLNALWVVVYSRRLRLTAAFVLVSLACLLGELARRTRRFRPNHQARSRRNPVLGVLNLVGLRLAFSLYLGWATVAALVGVTSALWDVITREYSLLGWSVVFCATLAVFSLVMLFAELDPWAVVAVLWALIGVIARHVTSWEILGVCGATVSLLLASTIVWCAVRFRRSDWKQVVPSRHHDCDCDCDCECQRARTSPGHAEHGTPQAQAPSPGHIERTVSQ